jgi:hypothetical protein
VHGDLPLFEERFLKKEAGSCEDVFKLE